MRDQEWDSSSTELYSLHLAELVLCLSGLDSVDCESTLGIVDESEVLASLLNRDHIHVPGRVVGVCSHFPVDFDEPLHDDLGDFSAIEGVLQSVSKEYNERKAVSLLVRTRTTRTLLADCWMQCFAFVATHDGFGA